MKPNMKIIHRSVAAAFYASVHSQFCNIRAKLVYDKPPKHAPIPEKKHTIPSFTTKGIQPEAQYEAQWWPTKKFCDEYNDREITEIKQDTLTKIGIPVILQNKYY